MNPTTAPPYGKTAPYSESPQYPGAIGYNQVQGQGQHYGYVNGCSQFGYACQPVSTVYEKFKRIQSVVLSILQILIAVACIALNAVLIETINDGNHYEDSVFAIVAHGIWGGVIFIVTGCLGLAAGITKHKCVVIAYMVLCIIACVTAAAVVALGILGCVTSYHHDTLSMNIAITVLGAVEFVLALWGSFLGCAVACCGAPSTVSFVAPGGQPVQVVPVGGGQQVYVVTTPSVNPQYAPYNGNPGQFVMSAPTHQH